MNKSVISTSEFILDAPEVIEFKGKFIYKKYKTNETTSFNQDEVDAPRCIKLSFKTPELRNKDKAVSLFKNRLINLETLKDFSQKENEVSSANFSSVNFYDLGAEGKFFSLASGYYVQLLNNIVEDENITQEQKDLIIDISKNEKLSFYDKLKLISNSLNAQDNKFLEDVFVSRAEIEGIKFKKKNGEFEANSSIQNIIDNNLNIKINNKFLFNTLNSIYSDSLANFCEDIYPIMGNVKRLQNFSRSKSRASSAEETDYALNLKNIALEEVETDKVYHPEFKIVGFLIEKYRVDNKGNFKEEVPLLINNPEQNTIIDKNVLFGYRYLYQVRTIVEIKARCVASLDSTRVEYYGTFLMSSNPS